MANYSYSKISTYLQCPAKYKFTYVLGYKKLEKPSPHLFLGSNIHTALKKFFELEDFERTKYENLEKILREVWRNNFERQIVFRDSEEEKKYGLQAILMLRQFWNNEFLRQKPVFIEEYFDFQIKENVFLKGKIDRIDKEKDGYHVIDYKTGKEKSNDFEELQLLFYPLLFYKKTSKEVKKASFYYLNSGNFKSKKITENDLREAEREILKIIEEIESDNEFLPKPNNLCSYCSFLEICPARKEILKDDDFNYLNESPF